MIGSVVTDDTEELQLQGVVGSTVLAKVVCANKNNSTKIKMYFMVNPKALNPVKKDAYVIVVNPNRNINPNTE